MADVLKDIGSALTSARAGVGAVGEGSGDKGDSRKNERNDSPYLKKQWASLTGLQQFLVGAPGGVDDLEVPEMWPARWRGGAWAFNEISWDEAGLKLLYHIIRCAPGLGVYEIAEAVDKLGFEQRPTRILTRMINMLSRHQVIERRNGNRWYAKAAREEVDVFSPIVLPGTAQGVPESWQKLLVDTETRAKAAVTGMTEAVLKLRAQVDTQGERIEHLEHAVEMLRERLDSQL